MTLILYIPFNNGALMISDRQNTYFEDLTREPIDKIVTLPNIIAVLGFAGPTQKCRYLIDRLRQINAPTSFEEAYRELYQECYGSPELGFSSDDIELLVVTHAPAGEDLIVHKILGAIMNEIDGRRCVAIGNGAKYIIPQLQLNTLTISREQAEEFGSTLLAYVSIIDISVGNPTTYGYNVVFIGTDNGDVLTRNPQNVDIRKLLYNFEE